MVQETAWQPVEGYFVENLLAHDPSLLETLANNKRAELPAIDVSPTEGKMLQLMARMVGARRILEVGTLGGYSTIWLARALPENGRLITIELSAVHAEVALQNINAAGVGGKVEVKVGAGLDVMPKLAGDPPFDFIFIDADKANVPGYFEWALKLSHAGSVIVVDNVVRGGKVVEPTTDDPNIRGIRTLAESLRDDKRVSATALQTVGSKGYDGFLVAIVN
ncbi:MAG TPA: O-methyltransferase [Fimbriimonadaceae bacterium]|nr:O-methyltransferase [Fimbriimonadaceae bacterium]